MTIFNLPRRAPHGNGPDRRDIARFILLSGEQAGCKFHVSLELECPSCVDAPFLVELERLTEAYRATILEMLAGGAP